MYGNVDAALLWLIILSKYWINEFYLKRIESDSCIFYKKYDNGKLTLVMSVHVDDFLIARKPEALEKIKEMINLKFNIQESGKLKKFLEVYYEWVRDTKVLYAKMTI